MDECYSRKRGILQLWPRFYENLRRREAETKRTDSIGPVECLDEQACEEKLRNAFEVKVESIISRLAMDGTKKTPVQSRAPYLKEDIDLISGQSSSLPMSAMISGSISPRGPTNHVHVTHSAESYLNEPASLSTPVARWFFEEVLKLFLTPLGKTHKSISS